MNVTNIADIRTLNVRCNDSNSLVIKPATRGNAGQVLSSLGNGNVEWVSNGNFGKTTSVVDSPLITGLTEQNIINNAYIGNLSFLANSLSVGDTYSLKCIGIYNAVNNDTVIIRLNFGGLQIAQIQCLQNTTTNTVNTSGTCEIEGTFTVRTLGVNGVGSVSAYLDFSYIADNGGMRGTRNINVNTTNINTTVNNSLGFTAQFSTSSASNNIQVRQMVCSKLY